MSSPELDLRRVEHPEIFVQAVTFPKDGLRARHIEISQCNKKHAVELMRIWHSRLPNTQENPWQYAFKAHYGPITYAVALWNNPSARTLPHHWLELRRMACAPDAPKFTASKMLSAMTRYFKQTCPEREKCISYQDIEVHSGTIYKASNWTPEYFSRPRARDRSKNRVGTNRKYRSDINTKQVASAGKIRWAYWLDRPVNHQEIAQEHERIVEQIKRCKGITK